MCGQFDTQASSAGGVRAGILPVKELSRYMAHLNHATMILNPELRGRKTTSASAFRKLGDKLNVASYREILLDDSLDG